MIGPDVDKFSPSTIVEPVGQGDALSRQVQGLIEQTNARGHRVFTGRLDRASLGLGERLITRMVQAPEGDFRDWEAIDAWAREIASELNGILREPPTS